MENIPCGIQNHRLLPLLYIDQLYDPKEVKSPLCAIFFHFQNTNNDACFIKDRPKLYNNASPNVWVIDLQPGL